MAARFARCYRYKWQEYEMRTTVARFAIAVLFTSVGFGQSPDRTFYFSRPASKADMTAMATMIRTVVDLQEISVDEAHQALVSNGPVDKMVVTEWLFHQLDRQAGQSPASASPEYRMAGDKGEVVSVFRLPASASNADLTSLVTALRTVDDLQRLFPYQGQNAIVARGPAERIAAADWIVHQLYPADGTAPSGDSATYPAAFLPVGPAAGENQVIHIFRMDPKSTNADLTSMVTAIRTVADLMRLFPFESEKAVIAEGPAEKMAVAEWLIHELGKPSDPQATHETRLAGDTDYVVRLFYVGQPGSPADLASLLTQIRSTGIMRIFPFSKPAAVVLRGRPDQMPTVEALVTKFGAEVH
jgi:hypothetical protein